MQTPADACLHNTGTTASLCEDLNDFKMSVDPVLCETESAVVPVNQTLVMEDNHELRKDSSAVCALLTPNNHSTPHYTSLTALFSTIHEEIDNVLTIFQALRPYIVRAIERDPESVLLKEILEFTDDMIEMHDKVSVTKGQIFSIVSVLNDNQILIEEDEILVEEENESKKVANTTCCGTIESANSVYTIEEQNFLTELNMFDPNK